jgi:hypothetical protein
VHDARITHAEQMHQDAIDEHAKTLKSLKGKNWIKKTVNTAGAGLHDKKRTPTDVLRMEARDRGIDTTGERSLCLSTYIDVYFPHPLFLSAARRLAISVRACVWWQV